MTIRRINHAACVLCVALAAAIFTGQARAEELKFLPTPKSVKALGGEIVVIAKPNCDHHPHSLTDPTPIVEFVLKHTAK